MARLPRSRYIIYIDASFGDGDERWFKLGKSLSSLDVELNPDVSTEKNIWDESYATDNGYTPQAAVEPYYADPDDDIYEKILDLAMNRRTGDACRTRIMEVIVDDDSISAHKAWVEDIIVKPTKTGGETAGFSIPFDIYFDGSRHQGTASYTGGTYITGTPHFAPESAE